ncbi:hypothetical protein L596_000307 [Steinernema carpocapsae]|uniref:Tc1-like transposase DDE domain-containing protein n=1 Tax=Steinernema carpocapsae TaxID=34508 RepID=A0A4U8UJZ4_STECR|nr:hypothetical protein L596_000307 [Steinernema carpocapsae]
MASARLSKDCERPKKPFPKVHHGLGGSFGRSFIFSTKKNDLTRRSADAQREYDFELAPHPTKWSPAPAPVVWDKNIWPPHSPDLNPLDFSVWSILGEKISGKRFETVKSLKCALQKAWKEISRN